MKWVLKKRECGFFLICFLRRVGQISIEDLFFKENVHLRFQ
ncbi:hypothetical protein LEP1GSC039_2278 [Leptospira santarosai str. 2000027870]|nr:hypothetical protein LEP1GSC039_2278 [Leptospira santarosai str. 2000027870]